MSAPEQVKTIFNTRLLRRILSFAAPYQKKLYLSFLLAIVIALITPLRPLLIQYSVDHIIRPGEKASELYKINLAHLLILVTLVQIGIIIVETAIRFVFSFTTSWLGQHVVKDIRVKVFDKILHLQLSQFNKTPIGTLTTRTINDIETINDVFSDGLIPILADLLSIVLLLLTMFWTDWRLTLVSLIPFPVLLIATYFFKESVNRSFVAVRTAVASLNSFVQEHISGMSLVQAFVAEDTEAEKFRNINAHHRNANISAIFAYSVFFPVVEIISAVSIGLLVWWGSSYHLQAGVLISFILYINLLFRPLRVIADKFNVLQMGMVASERVFRVLDNQAVTLPSNAAALYHPPIDTAFSGKVEFRKVSFGYQPDQPVLKEVSFVIEPGQTLAIVGNTGSGKTTIISLLNALYPVTEGEILINDRALNEYHPDALRSRIGIVLQDVFLFSGSVADNITLRNPDITPEQVMEAAKLIGLHDFILQLPGGYQFNVKERGATLSLGQRQLLSFIRALLYNPSILVLDEATSSVDTESEQLIQHAIDTLIAGRTSIVIAHRLSTIRKANKILVLDKGEVKEWGTHEELLAKKGQYYQLYRLQFGSV